MTPQEFLDWLLSITENFPTFGEFLGLDKFSEFLGFTAGLFNSLVDIFSSLTDLVSYGLMIFVLLISNFHVFIILTEIFIIGISCMKSTEPIIILTTFFSYNYLLLELIIKIIVGIYKMLGVIMYNVVRMIPLMGE